MNKQDHSIFSDQFPQFLQTFDSDDFDEEFQVFADYDGTLSYPSSIQHSFKNQSRQITQDQTQQIFNKMQLNQDTPIDRAQQLNYPVNFEALGIPSQTTDIKDDSQIYSIADQLPFQNQSVSQMQKVDSISEWIQSSFMKNQHQNTSDTFISGEYSSTLSANLGQLNSPQSLNQSENFTSYEQIFPVKVNKFEINQLKTDKIQAKASNQQKSTKKSEEVNKPSSKVNQIKLLKVTQLESSSRKRQKLNADSLLNVQKSRLLTSQSTLLSSPKNDFQTSLSIFQPNILDDSILQRYLQMSTNLTISDFSQNHLSNYNFLKNSEGHTLDITQSIETQLLEDSCDLEIQDDRSLSSQSQKKRDVKAQSKLQQMTTVVPSSELEILGKFKLEKGKHHWSDDKLFRQTKTLLQLISKEHNSQIFSEPSDEEVWLSVLLIFPNRGTEARRDNEKRERDVCQKLFETLDRDLINTFRKVFDNNNQTLICKLFTNKFLQKLWNLLIKQVPVMRLNSKILRTYAAIRDLVSQQFNLQVPDWLLDPEQTLQEQLLKDQQQELVPTPKGKSKKQNNE
eukprot:403334276